MDLFPLHPKTPKKMDSVPQTMDLFPQPIDSFPQPMDSYPRPRAIDFIPPKFTLPDIFMNYKGRRAGLIKALTTDFEELLYKCHPAIDAVCLYGFPNETWGLYEFPKTVPIFVPQPLGGINYVRDTTPRKDWLALVAMHSDLWLFALAFHHGAISLFDEADRKRLFDLMNQLPSIYEVVRDSSTKRRLQATADSTKMKKKLKTNSTQWKDRDNICGFCEDTYNLDDFWICCDTCERWYHGKCVDMTPQVAAHFALSECLVCFNKRTA